MLHKWWTGGLCRYFERSVPVSYTHLKLPDVLKEDGYPDVQAFMTTYRKAEAVVEQYNRDLAAWERQVREKQKPAQKEQAKPPRRESVLKRLRQLQAEGRRQKPKPKTHDRER